MKRKARFAEGVDVWTCVCGRVNIMGRTCVCGRTNADKLAGEVRELSKKEKRKPFKPVTRSDSGLLESYLKRKDAEK